MKKRTLVLSALLLFPLLQACSGQKSDDEPVTIKFIFQNQESFELSYGTEFTDTHPNIKLEIIPFDMFEESPEKLADIINNQKPDVIPIDSLAAYGKLASEGTLLNLDTLIVKDAYDLDAFIPGVVDKLRRAGGGSLYGLTPEIDTQALFYNKRLFSEYGIPYPKNDMTMEQFLQLAERFPTGGAENERVYGYYNYGFRYLTPYFGGLIELLAKSANLPLVDPATNQVRLDTEDWRHAFERGIQSFQSGTFRIDEDAFSNLFAEGRAAMQIAGLHLIENMRQYQSDHPEAPAVDWEFVTVPHEADGPNLAEWKLGRIYGIHADSPNQEAAWEFVKYMNGEKMQQSLSASTLVTRQALNVDREGRSVDSLLNIPSSDTRSSWDTLPNPFLFKFRELANDAVKKVLTSGVSLGDALAGLQTEGQAEWMLTQQQSESSSSAAEKTSP